MKFSSIIIIALICAVSSGTLVAQQTVTLGNLTSINNNWPFNYPGGTGRFQTAYQASELGMTGGGVISEIRVRGSTVSPPTYGLEINMGYTTNGVNALSGNFASNYTASSKQTVFGPASYTPAL
ncbi:MAG: hypothetical protein L3J82_04785 [Planctomycetes bacterium]|nr:hypothetical protein [Planctomycetota bacterium]